MNALKWIVMAAVLVGLSASSRAEDDTKNYAKLIVGKWEVSKADEGTVPNGTPIEFTKDGKIKAIVGQGDDKVTIEGTYKVVKDRIEMTLKRGDQEKSQTITITKLTTKEMVTKNEEGKVVELKKK